MNEKNPITRFFKGQVDDVIMSSIIVCSLIFIIIPKLVSLTPEMTRVFILVDYIFLWIFLFEFTFKMIFQGKDYFFKEDGWVDLIATIPIIIPLLHIILFKWNSAAYINSTNVSASIFLRGIGIIEVLRLLRMIRLLRLFYLLRSLSPLHIPKISIAWPSVFCIIFLVSGYFFMNDIRSRLQQDRQNTMLLLLQTTHEAELDTLINSSENILIISHSTIVKHKMPPEKIKKNFSPGESAIVESNNGDFIMFSYKDINTVMNQIQLYIFCIIIVFLMTIAMIFHISEKITKTEVKEALKEIIDINE